jgi:environmental stress-induced protein Ves
VPWKNGGGSTTEIAVDPPGSSVAEPFRWRISLASVAVSGPFSAFQGYERSIMLVGGAGMDLDFGQHGRARLAKPFEPVRFDGGWLTQATLIGGACADFNVMSDRSRIRHRLSVVAPKERLEVVPATTLAIVCFTGAVEIAGAGVPRLGPLETLIAEEPGPLSVGGDGYAAVVELNPA